MNHSLHTLLSLLTAQCIHDKIKSLDLSQVHAKIKQVDSHATLGNGIVVQVTLLGGVAPMGRQPDLEQAIGSV